MYMRVYLARHGEALSVQQDPDRSLSDNGRKQVSHVADILEQIGASVGSTIHSGKPRALQTAEILAQTVMREAELEAASDMNPTDPVEPWVERLATLERDTMLVGHLPFLSNLATRLVTGGDTIPVVSFPAGTVVCLERSNSGRWHIAAVVPHTL
jgi:phosphohistidine phosphatase